MSEFAVVLFVFFLIILFPLINLIGVVTGIGTQYLMTQQSASSAANSGNYGDAITAMRDRSTEFRNTGFARFAKLNPVGGFANSGADLYVIETDINTKQSTTYGPNSSVTGTIDPDNKVYEYQVRSTFNVGPFMNLASLPFIGHVEGLGRPITFNITNEKLVEHPGGIQENVPMSFSGGGFSIPPPPPAPSLAI